MKIDDLYYGWNEVDGYIPYFGWCDVSGCLNESCRGGGVWKETGYWKVCSKHSDDFENGKPQPKMKKKAIEKENRRDPKTGFLI